MSVETQNLVAPGDAQRFHTEGYHIARGLFSSEEIAEIKNSFMEVCKDGPVDGLSEVRRRNGVTYNPNDPLSRYPRMMHPHRHMDKAVGPVAMKYMLDRRVEEFLKAFFGSEPIAAQSMFYFKPPGARGQDFHQDNFYLRVKPGTCLAAWVAIDDCDSENGTMQVVPESSRMDIVCPEKSDSAQFFTTEHVEIPAGMKTVTMNLKAGDCLFFNGSIIHGSFPNTSPTRFRRSFICHYIPGNCVEVAQFYKPLLRFNGEVVEKAEATGGGPCGTMQDMVKGPH